MRVSVPTDEVTAAELKRIGASHADAYKTGVAVMISESNKEIVFSDGQGWETVVESIRGIPTRFRARTLEKKGGRAFFFTDTMKWVMILHDELRTYVLNESDPYTLALGIADIDGEIHGGPDGIESYVAIGDRLIERLEELYVRDVRW